MRVLHIVPDGLRFGGQEVYVANLLAVLREQGWSCDVALCAGGWFDGEADIVRLYEQAGARAFVTSPEALPGLAAEYDLVHVHSCFWVRWCDALPHPKVFTLHWDDRLPAGTQLDHLVCVSEAVRARQVLDAPCTFVPCAPDLARFDPERAAEIALPEEHEEFFARAPTMVRIARPQKVDAELFWNAAAQVLSERPVQLFVLAHDDRDRAFLRQLPLELQDRVLLARASGQVPAYLSRATLFLYAGIAEGGADDLVLKEAMAMRVPVAAVQAFASRSADEGGLLTARDPDALAQAALELLDDGLLREECGRRGRQAAERWSAQFAADYARIYRRLAPHASAAAPTPRPSGWRRPRDLVSHLGLSVGSELTGPGTHPQAGRWSYAVRDAPELEVLDWLAASVRLERPRRALVVDGSERSLLLLTIAEALGLTGDGVLEAVVESPEQARTARAALERLGLDRHVDVSTDLPRNEGDPIDLVVLAGAPSERFDRLRDILPRLDPSALVLAPDAAPQFGWTMDRVRDLLSAEGFQLFDQRSPRGVLSARRAPQALKIRSAFAGWGRLGLHGELGYEKAQVQLRGRRSETTISAHAPSIVRVEAAPGSTLHLTGALSDETCGEHVRVRFRVESDRGDLLADLGEAQPARPTPTTAVQVPADGLVVLRCEAEHTRFAHSVWLVRNARVLHHAPEEQLARLTEEALALVRQLPPGDDDAHELYVQTFGARVPMALRCVASHVLSAARRPRRVVLASYDDLACLRDVLPDWIEVWSGADRIVAECEAGGLTGAALGVVRTEQMFAKYALPRLRMGPRVLVCDDDVVWSGPCERLLTSDADVLFMEDPPGFYGPRAIELFQERGLVSDDAAEPPHVCAGLYLLNRKPVTDPEFIAAVLTRARHHTDEQSAVAMETRIHGMRREVLERPRYVHGGQGHHPVPPEAEVIHMQGYLVQLRENLDLQAWMLDRAIRRAR